eukprot:1191200-Prorocentrum_minimum.AAC.3
MFTAVHHIWNGACGRAELGVRKGSGGVSEGVLMGSGMVRRRGVPKGKGVQTGGAVGVWRRCPELETVLDNLQRGSRG